MLPFPGMPYGPAPAWVFPAFELSSYAMLALCLAHAIRRGRIGSLSYIFGGLGFGLLLEYLEVLSHSYTYGHFWLMFGHAPLNIPLCIGCDWAVIMYVSRLFSDALRLPWQAAAALDTLLALNVDLSLDIVAYRLHMWHWNWPPQYNPLTIQWFGIPYGNFVGWITVVFCYSFFSRWFERLILGRDHTLHHKLSAWRFPLVAALALFASQAVLTFNEGLLYPFVARHLGITSPRRFCLFTALLLITFVAGWRRRPKPRRTISVLATFAPIYFHTFFLLLFFAFAFYREDRWMTAVSCINGVLGIGLHLLPLTRSAARAAETQQRSFTEAASA